MSVFDEMKLQRQSHTNIVVTLQVEGLHNWPQAASICPEVGFLSHPHRHIFHVKCEKRVHHNDRDIEIIMFKREVLAYLKTLDVYSDKPDYRSSIGEEIIDFGSRSCEDIAKLLVEFFDLERAEVLEDNENGAIVYR